MHVLVPLITGLCAGFLLGVVFWICQTSTYVSREKVESYIKALKQANEDKSAAQAELYKLRKSLPWVQGD